MTGVAIDVAYYIWLEMREFAQAAKPKENLAFGNLVTRLCDLANVKHYAHNTLLPPRDWSNWEVQQSKKGC